MLTTTTEEASPPGVGVAVGAPWMLRYWSFFLGQAASLIGSALTQFVLLWWITDKTGSVSALATAGFFALFPQALLGPLGGTFADRYNRRFLMIAADSISALCMVVLIVLFLANAVALWHIYTMMALRSAMQAFQAPAAAASTAMLVPQTFLPRAAGLNQTLMGIMSVAAPPLGALAISLMPIGWALVIDVATAALGIAILLCFQIPQPPVAADGRSSLWKEFREGVDVVWHSPLLRRLYGLMTAVVLIVMPCMTLLPLLVKVHFQRGASDVALIEGVGGVAMIVTGVAIAAIAPRRLIPWILWGYALSCVTLGLTALAPTDKFWLAVAFWTISCVAYIAGNAPFMTFVQLTVPNQLQGRVLSLLTTLTGLAAPIGIALAMPLGEALGIRKLFLVLGLMGGGVCLAGFVSPVLRQTSCLISSTVKSERVRTSE